jgi:hypothetical protein
MVDSLTDLSGCIEPLGDYLNTCNNIEMSLYRSTDSYVPNMCKLTADCESTMYLDDVHNEIYLPKDTTFKNLNNIKGILCYGSSPLNIVASSTDTEAFLLAVAELGEAPEVKKAVAAAEQKIIEQYQSAVPLLDYKSQVSSIKLYEFKSCSQLSGSYQNSCTSESKPYTSTDINLANTELCEVELSCAATDGKKVESTTVYSNINDKAEAETVQRLENCDGRIVVGNRDDQCADTAHSSIQDLANKAGKSGRFTS